MTYMTSNHTARFAKSVFPLAPLKVKMTLRHLAVLLVLPVKRTTSTLRRWDTFALVGQVRIGGRECAKDQGHMTQS